MVSVNKGAWDKSKGAEANHEFNRAWLAACQRSPRIKQSESYCALHTGYDILRPRRRSLMSLVFPAIRFQQRNTPMYIAVVTVGDLDHFSVALWNPESVEGRRGYQRKLDKGRVEKIARYSERRDAIMPVAGLLNIREKNALKFRNGILTVPDGVHAYVVDMQHRMKGLILAKDNKLIQRSFPFPVVFTEGLSHLDEAAQFYIINTKAKKMDVALTRRLLIENDRVKDIAEVKPWEVPAVRITIALNKKIQGNPWFGAIRQPNEEKLLSHVATEKSFVSSLRNLLIRKRGVNAERVARSLAAFWTAIRANIPDAFNEPKIYLIQKTAGIFAFNFFIAPRILYKYSDKEFVERLSGLKKLRADFWKGKNESGARKFGTGMAGYANLAHHVEKFL
jgi:DGQHR domain-containing protein